MRQLPPYVRPERGWLKLETRRWWRNSTETLYRRPRVPRCVVCDGSRSSEYLPVCSAYATRQLEEERVCKERDPHATALLGRWEIVLGSSSPRPAPVLASDAERDLTVERLRGAAVEGRLTIEELETREATALSSRTQAELDPLVRDLPALAVAKAPAGRPRRLVSPNVACLVGGIIAAVLLRLVVVVGTPSHHAQGVPLPHAQMLRNLEAAQPMPVSHIPSVRCVALYDDSNQRLLERFAVSWAHPVGFLRGAEHVTYIVYKTPRFPEGTISIDGGLSYRLTGDSCSADAREWP